jgi:hypothetical protein
LIVHEGLRKASLYYRSSSKFRRRIRAALRHSLQQTVTSVTASLF